MSRATTKRHTDFQIISNWIQPGSRVLDLGCGRGVFLEHLVHARSVHGIGVDLDLSKIQSGVRRGLSVYQGDAEAFMGEFPDNFFDAVILSRTLHELPHPGRVMKESLRVGRTLAVGFINYAYWRNRWALLRTGERIHNEVYPRRWAEESPSNPTSIAAFEDHCESANYHLRDHVYLRGDWKTPLHALPNLRAGYALYLVERNLS